MFLKEDRDLPADKEPLKGEEPKVDDYRIFSVTCATADVISETCLKLRVCPLCMYFRLRGEDFRNVKEPACGNDKVIPFLNNNGWANAMARAHNKEQHATNVNITDSTITSGRATQESLMMYDGGRGWEMPAISCIGRENQSQIEAECEKYIAMSFYSDSHQGGSNTYVGAGILYQPARGRLRSNNFEVIDEEAGAEVGAHIRHRVLLAREGYLGIGVVEDHAEGPELPPRRELQTWIGVGANKSKHHGRIVLTDLGESMSKVLKDPEDKSGMLNMNMSRSVYNYCVGGGALAMASSISRSSDWRELGIKASLYDDLRERRFTQPTGVDWAIANRQKVKTTYLPSEKQGWGYDACAVSWRYLDRYLLSSGKVPVGANRDEYWNINSDEVIVIGVAHNSPDAGCGRDIWILSHLDYPLVYCVDTFRILTTRANGNVNSKEVEFVRTSILVDIHSGARKILFVFNTDTQREISIGDQVYQVGQINRFGEPMAGQEPLIYPFDIALDNLLERTLGTAECLREAFDTYACAYFPGGLDWMEVNNICAVLKVRWHNKPSDGW